MAALTPLDGGRIKKSRASLVGGIAVGIGIFVLWAAIAQELGAAGVGPLIGGALAGLVVGLWVWKADL